MQYCKFFKFLIQICEYIRTDEWKVKYETLIEQNDKKQQEWIQNEAILRKQILALEKQRKEDAQESANQTKKLKDAMKEIAKLQKEMEQLKFQQTEREDSAHPEFRELLVNIAQELTTDEWRNMCYRFSIPGNRPDCAMNLFWWLVETAKITPVDLNLLEELLTKHNRQRLVQQFINPYRLKNAILQQVDNEKELFH